MTHPIEIKETSSYRVNRPTTSVGRILVGPEVIMLFIRIVNTYLFEENDQIDNSN